MPRRRTMKSFNFKIVLTLTCLALGQAAFACDGDGDKGELMEFQDMETEARVYELEKNFKEFTTEFGQKHLLVNETEERLLEG
jgi:hypothetical protein